MTASMTNSSTHKNLEIFIPMAPFKIEEPLQTGLEDAFWNKDAIYSDVFFRKLPNSSPFKTRIKRLRRLYNQLRKQYGLPEVIQWSDKPERTFKKELQND